MCVSRGVIGVVGICPKFTLGRGKIRCRGPQSRQRMGLQKNAESPENIQNEVGVVGRLRLQQ